MLFRLLLWRIIITTDTNTLVAKTAILKDIDEYGSNWGSDASTNNACVVDDTVVSQSNNGDVITLNAYLNGQNVTITGTPLSKSENGNVTYFDGSVNNADYDVVLFSFEKEIQDSVVYFKGYMQENGKTDGNILKVYLKDNNSPTKDYIVLEVFDYELPFAESDIANLDVDAIPGAWVADEFEAVSMEKVDDPVPYTDSKLYEQYRQTFYVGDYQQVHMIRLEYYTELSNLRVYGTSDDICRLTVDSKSITVASAPNLNSSTQSSLYVSAATLEQYSAPNTAWTHTKLDGWLYSTTGYLGSISVGLSYAGITVGADLAAIFNNHQTIDIDGNYIGYTQGGYDDEGNKLYAKGIQTPLKSNMRLTNPGHYFEVTSTLKDYGNTPQGAELVKNEWQIKITSSITKVTNSYTFAIPMYIRILA